MLLAEVALGNINKLKQDQVSGYYKCHSGLIFLQYMEKAPAGTHSTQALGMAAPDPAGAKELYVYHDGCHCPIDRLNNTMAYLTHFYLLIYPLL